MSDPTLGTGAAIVAFDVGGTDIKSALFDETGVAIELQRTPTPQGVPALMAELATLSAGLRERHPQTTAAAAGLVVPGIVDATAGVGVFSSNMGWRDAPLQELASDALSLPVAFDHDVRSGSYAESKIGNARGFSSVVTLIIGTGVAGTLYLDDRWYSSGGYAGEVGHMPVPGGLLCACGASGCLETIASAGAIERRYESATGTEVNGARDVIARAGAGDEVAARIWNEALEALTFALAQLTAVLAPDAVLIGGGLARAGDALFEQLRTRLGARLSFHRAPVILPALLGGNAGLMGAALRARELV